MFIYRASDKESRSEAYFNDLENHFKNKKKIKHNHDDGSKLK